MTKVKICGITNLEDALEAVNNGYDALGFIFADSPRKINIEAAEYILKALPPFTNCVAVFMNENPAVIKNILKNCPFDTIQFHGEENPQVLMQFKPQKKIIKSIRVKNEQSIDLIEEYKEADAFLLDTYVKDIAGGTGQVFDWQIARTAKKYNKPIILSGGLNPENIQEAIKSIDPFAVDVSSGVEEHPGKKSRTLMKDFIKKIKGNNYYE
jgi:phosphoribosylanthranilate isomerase